MKIKIQNITDSDRMLRKHGQIIFVGPHETIEIEEGGLRIDTSAFEIINTEKKSEKKEENNNRREVKE